MFSGSEKGFDVPIIKPINGHYFIKWLHSGLYAAAAELECESCENFWTKAIIKQMMVDERMGGLVICDYDDPVGYIVYESSRADREICVLNLVIRSDHRRQGLGKILIDRLMSKPQYDTIKFYVRESNLGGHLFLKSLGFKATGVCRDFFEDVYFQDEAYKEDAYRFELHEEVNHEDNDTCRTNGSRLVDQ